MSCELKVLENEKYTEKLNIDYFSEDYWELVSSSCANFEETINQIRFLHNYFKNKKVKKILDMMCGNCRHILGLNKLGYEVSGMDINKELLERVMYNKNYSNDIKLYSSDVFDFSVEEKYDVVTLLQSCMGYFENDYLILEKAFNFLNYGGFILIDIPNKYKLDNYFIKKEWTNVNDKFFLFDNKYIDNIKYVSTKVIGKNYFKEYKLKMKIYDIDELVSLLTKVGFINFEILMNFSFDNQISLENCNRIQIVAFKGEKNG